MCILIFDYKTADDPNQAYKQATITAEERQEFEDRINKKYAKYCQRINAEGGLIRVSITWDGKHPIEGHLFCSEGLYKEIHP